MVVELNRRLVKGYTQFQDDPRIVKLKDSITTYNKQLRLLGLRDHQVDHAKFSLLKVVFTFIYRVIKLIVLFIGTLPGLALFAPVFVATKVISRKKSVEALAASSVKLQGKDVMATWKLLVALAFAPALYAFYTAVFVYWAYRNRIQGYVPKGIPLWTFVPFGFILFPAITFAALRIGEIGMDLFKSLRPLVLSLNPSSANTLEKLRKRRHELSLQVTELINTLGPELYPDFDSTRIVADPFRESNLHIEDHGHVDDRQLSKKIDSHLRPEGRSNSITQEQLPRNESFHDIANIGFFSTRPPSRNRSRSSSTGGLAGSSGFHLKAFSQLNSKDSLDEVSKRIRGAMRERGQERRRQSEDLSWEMASVGSMSPPPEEAKKDQ